MLTVLRALDRESQSFYNLVVQVHDLPPHPASRLTSTAHVSIILLDVNDNPPTFLSPKLTFVPENTPIDTVVFKAQATDPDSGPNSYIEYTLLNPVGHKFSVGTIDGEVRLTGELDREEVSNYTLTVVATDKGQPPLSSSTEVVLMVLDINDNSPVFAQAQYKVEIHENTLTGTDIIQVCAADGDEGTNGQVRYGIVDGNANQEFRIDSVTGAITVAKPLDREKTPTYFLTVQATDRGSTPRTDTSTVSVLLLDINDFVPMFELSPYSVNVPENLETLPKTILQVSIFKENEYCVLYKTSDLITCFCFLKLFLSLIQNHFTAGTADLEKELFMKIIPESVLLSLQIKYCISVLFFCVYSCCSHLGICIFWEFCFTATVISAHSNKMVENFDTNMVLPSLFTNPTT